MPVYAYQCEGCGPFEAIRPMAEHDRPLECPRCGGAAPRAFLAAPRLAMMDAGLRTAHATNERSAHEPKHLAHACAGHDHDHGHDHGHGTKAGRKVGGRAVHLPDGSKTFPSARPWMISH